MVSRPPGSAEPPRTRGGKLNLGNVPRRTGMVAPARSSGSAKQTEEIMHLVTQALENDRSRFRQLSLI